MKKSIEEIWKSGFEEEDEFVVPRINNLYNQKSLHITDKIMRMRKINMVALVIGGLVFFLAGIALKTPVTGFIMLLLLLWLVMVDHQLNKKMDLIYKGQNSYEYLVSVDKWLKNNMRTFTHVYRIFYPLFFVVFMIGMATSSIGEETIQKFQEAFPEMPMIGGMPLYYLIGIGVGAGLLTFFSAALYKWDVNIVYGKTFNKLREMIMDMEELKG